MAGISERVGSISGLSSNSGTSQEPPGSGQGAGKGLWAPLRNTAPKSGLGSLTTQSPLSQAEAKSLRSHCQVPRVGTPPRWAADPLDLKFTALGRLSHRGAQGWGARLARKPRPAGGQAQPKDIQPDPARPAPASSAPGPTPGPQRASGPPPEPQRRAQEGVQRAPGRWRPHQVRAPGSGYTHLRDSGHRRRAGSAALPESRRPASRRSSRGSGSNPARRPRPAGTTPTPRPPPHLLAGRPSAPGPGSSSSSGSGLQFTCWATRSLGEELRLAPWPPSLRVMPRAFPHSFIHSFIRSTVRPARECERKPSDFCPAAHSSPVGMEGNPKAQACRLPGGEFLGCL